MTLTLNLFPATIVTADTIYEKAKFVSSLGDGDAIEAQIIGRDGHVFASAVGEVVPAGNRAWTFTATDGTVWQVTQQRGCGCGGTVVRAR